MGVLRHAGGAGIHGCIEMGSSVLALCYDEHLRTHLGQFLVQRAVEAMLGRSTMVFTNESLVARATQLRLTKEDTRHVFSPAVGDRHVFKGRDGRAQEPAEQGGPGLWAPCHRPLAWSGGRLDDRQDAGVPDGSWKIQCGRYCTRAVW